jgi:hypothetical protein
MASNARRRTVVLVVTVALASAAIASAATSAITHRGRRGNPATSASPSVATVGTSTVPTNLVYRVGQSARLDDWTVVIDSYEVAATFRGLDVGPGAKVLIARFEDLERRNASA